MKKNIVIITALALAAILVWGAFLAVLLRGREPTQPGDVGGVIEPSDPVGPEDPSDPADPESDAFSVQIVTSDGEITYNSGQEYDMTAEGRTMSGTQSIRLSVPAAECEISVLRNENSDFMFVVDLVQHYYSELDDLTEYFDIVKTEYGFRFGNSTLPYGGEPVRHVIDMAYSPYDVIAFGETSDTPFTLQIIHGSEQLRIHFDITPIM